jgi:hypothetical protein
MINLTSEEAQQVLDALECATPPTFSAKLVEDWGKAVKFLRAKLSEPEPKPVAWMVYTLDGTSVCITDNPADFTPEHKALPLYTDLFQREWVGLTDKERAETWNKCDPYDDVDDFALAIEAKLKEKNGN